MTLRVVQGDALEVTGVPALVVPANRQLTLGWGSHVAEAVLKRAGRAVEREALAQFPDGVALGEAVLTGAGSLAGFTHLIHAAVLDRYDLNPLFLLRLRERTSEATLRAATTHSLELALEAGLSGVVLTLMGAGIGGMRSAKCARILVDQVRALGDVELEVVLACWKRKDAALCARLCAEQ